MCMYAHMCLHASVCIHVCICVNVWMYLCCELVCVCMCICESSMLAPHEHLQGLRCMLAPILSSTARFPDLLGLLVEAPKNCWAALGANRRPHRARPVLQPRVCTLSLCPIGQVSLGQSHWSPEHHLRGSPKKTNSLHSPKPGPRISKQYDLFLSFLSGSFFSQD